MLWSQLVKCVSGYLLGATSSPPGSENTPETLEKKGSPNTVELLTNSESCLGKEEEVVEVV